MVGTLRSRVVKPRRRRRWGWGWVAIAVCLAAGVTRLPGARGASFATDILPVLTKAGCNAGACHGAATGQGGFKLSLLGYDPAEDHARITRELGGRRIDLEQPVRSLVLLKASGGLEHEGGRRLRRNSDGYEAIRQWVASGAPYGSRDLRVTGIVVEPADTWLETTNRTVSLRVIATQSDGTKKEVTTLALYTSNDDGVAEVSKWGEVTTRGRGLTSVMVRYAGQVAAARVAVPLGEAGGTGLPGGEFAGGNFIDRAVAAELVRLRVPVSPLSEDAEFLRRIHLDLTGRLPSSEAAREFLAAAPSGEKRERVIDRLLRSDDFVDYWTLWLADLLLVGGKGSRGEAARVYHGWLREQVATNAPVDRMVLDLLTATGDVTRVGPANFAMLANDPRDLAEHVGRMFLGAQIACARCHTHPADRWTQDDYHQFAAHFARVTRADGVVRVSDQGEVDHPKTGRPMAPKPLGALEGWAGAGERRATLAAWLTDRGNRRFTRAMANRVWKQLFGRGLVEPVDDLRPTNPPTHPELLEALADEFSAGGMDLRRLIRTIVRSRTYQLTARPRGLNQSDDRLYSHAYLKPLPAAVFADGVAQVTGVPDSYAGHAAGTRAVQLVTADTPAPALDVLGRCSRDRPCDSPGRAGGGLAQALHLINGSTINDKLEGGVVRELISAGRMDGEIVEELYLRALTRRPTAEEGAGWERFLAGSTNRTEAVQDLLWALLNSREFAFNH